MEYNLLKYDLASGVVAFSTLRPAGVPRPQARAVGLPWPVLQPHQVHGVGVTVVSARTRRRPEDCDAVVTDLRDFAIGVRTADCIPVLLYDPVRQAVAAIHAGWKGTVLKIVAKTVSVMAESYGTSPADLRALIGPGISPDSFQVGPEVAERFAAEGFPLAEILSDRGPRVPGTMQGGLHIDLWQANRWLLETLGVPPEHITVTGLDTYTDSRFWSARRDGPACGRLLTAIRLCK